MKLNYPDPATKPAFFTFSDNTNHTRGNPWASNIARHDDPHIWTYHKADQYLTKGKGNPVAFISDVGSKWSDIIGSGGSGDFQCMITARVVDGLHAAGIDCFSTEPVQIVKIESKKLRDVPPPDYFVFDINGRMDFDVEASKKEHRVGLNEASRKFPVVDTWDGADLFVAGNWETGYLFCTEKVLTLAREHKWTNFRFTPIDAWDYLCFGWKGIDYLGKKWPPKAWYPPRPSDGKTIEEWLDTFASAEDAAKWYDAYKAILELGEDALPAAIRRCLNADKESRPRWSRMLDVFWRHGAKLPDAALDAIEEDGPFPT